MMQSWKIIKTEADYQHALKRTIDVFDAEPGSENFEELELLLVLVKDYEDRNIVIPELDPLEVVKLKMEEKGIKAKDLEDIIGSKGRVSLILSGKEELTLKMAKALHTFLGIPAEVFLSGGIA
ncbi:helix-turn-helix domain-containing protein [bacterium]|nr:MAG: helix-turn-helix domain-containing protein [bacterium]